MKKIVELKTPRSHHHYLSIHDVSINVATNYFVSPRFVKMNRWDNKHWSDLSLILNKRSFVDSEYSW